MSFRVFSPLKSGPSASSTFYFFVFLSTLWLLGCIASAIFLLAHAVFNYSLLCCKATMQMAAMRHSLLGWWRNLTQRWGSVPQLTCGLRSPQVCLWCLSEQFCSVPAPILHSAVAFLKSQPLNKPPHCPMLGTKPDLPPNRKEKGMDSLSFPSSPDKLLCLLSHPISSSVGGQVTLLVFG